MYICTEKKTWTNFIFWKHQGKNVVINLLKFSQFLIFLKLMIAKHLGGSQMHFKTLFLTYNLKLIFLKLFNFSFWNFGLVFICLCFLIFPNLDQRRGEKACCVWERLKIFENINYQLRSIAIISFHNNKLT